MCKLAGPGWPPVLGLMAHRSSRPLVSCCYVPRWVRSKQAQSCWPSGLALGALALTGDGQAVAVVPGLSYRFSPLKPELQVPVVASRSGMWSAPVGSVLASPGVGYEAGL